MRSSTFRIIFTSLCLSFLCSCSTPKQITYFQDVKGGDSAQVAMGPTEILVQPKDKLSIFVNSQDPRLTTLFNLTVVTQQIGDNNFQSRNQGVLGYVVDSEGNIDFPIVGKLYVKGLTREKVSALVKSELVSRDLVKDPVVTVEYMNLAVSVMGEVSHPGKYNIDKDCITILDALSMAGDLTIYGRRENVLVLRGENGSQHIYRVNLCSARQLLASPVYYLRQNDVVYVEPNKTKVRESTVNGNNVRSSSFWISVASLMTSVAVLIMR